MLQLCYCIYKADSSICIPNRWTENFKNASTNFISDWNSNFLKNIFRYTLFQCFFTHPNSPNQNLRVPPWHVTIFPHRDSSRTAFVITEKIIRSLFPSQELTWYVFEMDQTTYSPFSRFQNVFHFQESRTRKKMLSNFIHDKLTENWKLKIDWSLFLYIKCCHFLFAVPLKK